MDDRWTVVKYIQLLNEQSQVSSVVETPRRPSKRAPLLLALPESVLRGAVNRNPAQLCPREELADELRRPQPVRTTRARIQVRHEVVEVSCEYAKQFLHGVASHECGDHHERPRQPESLEWNDAVYAHLLVGVESTPEVQQAENERRSEEVKRDERLQAEDEHEGAAAHVHPRVVRRSVFVRPFLQLASVHNEEVA